MAVRSFQSSLLKAVQRRLLDGEDWNSETGQFAGSTVFPNGYFPSPLQQRRNKQEPGRTLASWQAIRIYSHRAISQCLQQAGRTFYRMVNYYFVFE